MRSLLAVLLYFGLMSALARAEAKHVLVVSSAERPVAPQSGFADVLVRDLIRSSRDPIQFVEVSVESARATDEPSRSIAQRIRAVSGLHRPHLVITIGGPAATFIERSRDTLFSKTPILIAGVDRRFVDNAVFTANQTTVATQHDPALIIDEMLRLLPETRHVLVIIGSSPVEQFWLQQMKRDFRRFDDRVQFSWTNTLSFDEIKDRSRTMPAHAAIFFALLAVDGKGEPQVDGQTLKSLHAVANAPLFALYGMGDGIVGGPLLSTEDLSRKTTEVALRLLAGESPSNVKTPVQRTGRPTYDARELRRWHIDERLLPPSSVLLFREATTWERNRGPIALGAVLGAVIVVAFVPFLGVMKRRRAKGPRLDLPADVLSPLDATVRIWTAGPDGERADVGQTPAGHRHSTWTTHMHPDDIERCEAIVRGAIARRESFQMEYRLRDVDGAERWMLDTGVVRRSPESFDGFVGSTVDITALAHARAELVTLSRHLIQEHERERAALAKTLHNEVAQRMAALTLRLHALQGGASDAEVADIRERLSSLVAEIAAAPDPVYVQLELLGLATTARRLCEELSSQYNVTIHFQDEDIPRDLPFNVALTLVRVLEEATVNAAVHSEAREVWVTMRGTASEIRLQVVDRGIGFETPRALQGAGVGLVSLRERLKVVNGDSLIASRLGDGTRVEAWVPLIGG